MRFRFNDKKTAQIAAFLLKLHGGAMNYMKLIKLMYLADREKLLAHGVPMTGDTMVAMRHGPVLSHVLDFINLGEDHQQSEWFKLIAPPSNYEVSLRPDVKGPVDDELSESEMDTLKTLHTKFGAMDKWKLVELLHETLPEWKDPGYSAFTITPAEILRAEDRSDEEIAEVKKTADDLWFLGGSPDRRLHSA